MWVQKSKKVSCKQKDCIRNPSTHTSRNGKYLRIIIGDSLITCGQIIEVTKIIPTKTTPSKTVPKNLNKQKLICKIIFVLYFLTFLLIFISTLMMVSIYCCFLKHRSKLKHLLPYNDTSSKLKQVNINNKNWK